MVVHFALQHTSITTKKVKFSICKFLCDPCVDWYYPEGLTRDEQETNKGQTRDEQVLCFWCNNAGMGIEVKGGWVPFDCPYAEFHSEYDPNEKKDLEIDQSIKGVQFVTIGMSLYYRAWFVGRYYH